MKKRKNNTMKKCFIKIIGIIILLLIIIFAYKVAHTINMKSKMANSNKLENYVKDNEKQENNTMQDNNINTKTNINNAVNEEKKLEQNIKANTIGIPVLMYHFFYDESKGKGKDNNWMSTKEFEEQVKYLSDSKFYFPSWEELENYINGNTTLPEKSVIITADDGDDSFFDLAVPIIQKYDAKATTFVITSWYGYRADSKMNNISYQSHSDCMHEGGKDGKGVMLSWSYDKILADLKQSSTTLGGSTVFCYPFGQYNDTDKKAVKAAGYKLAFTTKNGRVKKGDDRYELKRVRISKGTSINSFKSMVD